MNGRSGALVQLSPRRCILQIVRTSCFMQHDRLQEANRIYATASGKWWLVELSSIFRDCPLLLVASLLLVLRPGAPSSVLAPSSDALCS